VSRPHKGARLLLLAALSCLAATAQAAAPGCEASATGPAFGAYYPSDPVPATTTGTISIQCVRVLNNTPYNVQISLSAGGAGNFTRRMSAGANRLYYNIYREGSYSSIWGNGSGGSQTVSMSVPLPTPALFGIFWTGTAVRTMFARVNAAQYVPTGAYSDTITVTINY
jgi:spore coat protein U-like protein